MTRQEKVALALGNLNLHGDVLIVGLLSDANDLISRLVVTELIAQSEINTKVRSGFHGPSVDKVIQKVQRSVREAHEREMMGSDRGEVSVPSSTDGIGIVRLNLDLSVHSSRNSR